MPFYQTKSVNVAAPNMTQIFVFFSLKSFPPTAASDTIINVLEQAVQYENKRRINTQLPAMGIRPQNMFWKHNQHHSSSVCLFTLWPVPSPAPPPPQPSSNKQAGKWGVGRGRRGIIIIKKRKKYLLHIILSNCSNFISEW